MSITDELRDAIATATKTYEDSRNPYNDRETCHIPEEHLLGIADRIDKTHDEMREQAANGELLRFIDCHGPDGTHDEYLRIPVDADGVDVHVGDHMTDSDGELFVVSSMDYGLHPVVHDGMGWVLWSADAETMEHAALCRHAKTAQELVEESLYRAAMLDREGKYNPSASVITTIANRLIDRLAQGEWS